MFIEETLEIADRKVVLRSLPFTVSIGVKRVLTPIFGEIFSNVEEDEDGKPSIEGILDNFYQLGEVKHQTIIDCMHKYIYQIDDKTDLTIADIDGFFGELSELDIILLIKQLTIQGVISDDDKKK